MTPILLAVVLAISGEIDNPNIDMPGYLRAAHEAAAYRQTLLRLDRSASVVRSISVVVLSVVVPPRVLPLLRAHPLPDPGRAPAYRNA